MNAYHAEFRAASRAALLGLLGLALLAAGAPADTKDVKDLIRFRDEYKAPAVGTVPNYEFHPWRAGEIDRVLTRMRLIRAKAPGVVERATARRAIQCYRVRGLVIQNAVAVPMENAILIADGSPSLLPFPVEGPGNPMTAEEQAELRKGEQALFQVLVYLADPFLQTARDKEWVDMIKPRLQRVNSVFVRRSGMTIQQFYREKDRHEALERDLRTAATAEGFPTPYAASDLAVSLSEITSSMLVDPSYVPPVEIKAYVRRAVLSMPYRSDPATVALHRAADAMALGDLNAALRALDEVSEGEAISIEASWFRSLIWEKKGDFGRAASELGPAVDLTAGLESRFALRRAQLEMQVGAIDRAIEDFTAVLKHDPSFLDVRTTRAHCYLIKGDHDAAIQDLDKAILLRPKSSAALGLRGLARVGQKDYAKAIEDFDEAAWYDFSNHAALNGRARLRATCPEARYRDGKAATLDAGRACELTGWKEPKYLDTLAAAHAEAGDFKQAVQWQRKAVEQAPASLKAKYQARLALYAKGQPFREKE